MRTFLDKGPTDRVGRYPKHPFQVRSVPFTAQPFFIARVLPGESRKNLKLESRVITDPILNSIIGWKQEYYFFYVPITALLQDAFKDMFVDPSNGEIPGFDTVANDTTTYSATGSIDWTKLCRNRVVETYFRDEGELASDFALADGTPIVQIRDGGWLDSLTDKDLLPEGDAIAGATDMGDLDRLMDAFEQLRALGMANMTYEDWLRSNGIAIPNKDENKPELISRFSDWQYPSNTINPANGVPASAVSYVFNNSDRDPKFFKEPGFLIGLTITRPKVYFGGLAGSLAGFAQRAWDWMPNYLYGMPETSLRQFAADAGPLGARTTNVDAHWVDMRDELLYGDQFQNMRAFDPDTADFDSGSLHFMDLPDNNLNWKYPSEAMCKSFFVDAAGTAFYVRQDGYVSLNIMGLQADFTQANVANL